MTHYTILPDEVIYEGLDEHEPRFRDVEISGILMQVEAVDESRVRIVRLYSPEPKHYLNPLFTPGSLINYVPGPQGI
ncbi:YlzJ-like family protein [Paenibacillus chitinolyticus]|uniref:YlzJ-like family protein n=1 Tax=Paenibacillus chitinolyticus TaxID=79263 RepID=A0A410X0C1_9BACL|nr:MULTISPECIES: YlzJ-like family protein [Paenibacillus]MCY9592900.1 YlzJ-like family protein [Paenibacillus chitinolyticus]MCY9595907.1 YlzJ-like family protein [Paenibacillus chitinolyticus]QAV20027.1 hypothetical protein PC41400_21125 [Paenibacillus chitinolyticus]GKS09963.1 hypothetical protein YDYSY3_09630 [Paenibacillus chitinolyticus]